MRRKDPYSIDGDWLELERKGMLGSLSVLFFALIAVGYLLSNLIPYIVAVFDCVAIVFAGFYGTRKTLSLR